MTKTIIIHHMQAMWAECMAAQGKSYPHVLIDVYQHLIASDYDNVIVTNFESFELEDSQSILSGFSPVVHSYEYGWNFNSEQVTDAERVSLVNGHITTLHTGSKFTYSGAHSELVLLEPWMEKLSDQLFICGAFDSECIEDLETALHALNKKFTRIEKLII